MKFKLLKLICAEVFFALALEADAATRSVTKFADTNDGVCDADCSLREAIAVAGAGDTITFAVTGTITPIVTCNGSTGVGFGETNSA